MTVTAGLSRFHWCFGIGVAGRVGLFGRLSRARVIFGTCVWTAVAIEGVNQPGQLGASLAVLVWRFLFSWHLTVDLEPERTRGIRLSN